MIAAGKPENNPPKGYAVEGTIDDVSLAVVLTAAPATSLRKFVAAHAGSLATLTAQLRSWSGHGLCYQRTTLWSWCGIAMISFVLLGSYTQHYARSRRLTAQKAFLHLANCQLFEWAGWLSVGSRFRKKPLMCKDSPSMEHYILTLFSEEWEIVVDYKQGLFRRNHFSSLSYGGNYSAKKQAADLGTPFLQNRWDIRRLKHCPMR